MSTDYGITITALVPADVVVQHYYGGAIVDQNVPIAAADPAPTPTPVAHVSLSALVVAAAFSLEDEVRLEGGGPVPPEQPGSDSSDAANMGSTVEQLEKGLLHGVNGSLGTRLEPADVHGFLRGSSEVLGPLLPLGSVFKAASGLLPQPAHLIRSAVDAILTDAVRDWEAWSAGQAVPHLPLIRSPASSSLASIPGNFNSSESETKSLLSARAAQPRVSVPSSTPSQRSDKSQSWWRWPWLAMLLSACAVKKPAARMRRVTKSRRAESRRVGR